MLFEVFTQRPRTHQNVQVHPQDMSSITNIPALAKKDKPKFQKRSLETAIRRAQKKKSGLGAHSASRATQRVLSKPHRGPCAWLLAQCRQTRVMCLFSKTCCSCRDLRHPCIPMTRPEVGFTSVPCWNDCMLFMICGLSKKEPAK